MAVRIRKAEFADASRLAELVDALSAGEGEPRGLFTPERARLDGFGAAPEFAAAVAEEAGHIVGYALWHDSYSTEWARRGLYLQDLYVEPEARRAGIGRALMAAVAAEARARGRNFFWWCSRPGNRAANRFYATLGEVREPIVAHALAFEAFERLAEEGSRAAAGTGLQPAPSRPDDSA